MGSRLPGFLKKPLIRALHARGWRKADPGAKRRPRRNDGFAAMAEARALRRLIEALDVDLVMDVGANRGGFGRLLRGPVGYRGRILSYEPTPALADELRAAADPLWKVEEAALAETAGRRRLSLMAGDSFNSFATPKPDDDPHASPKNRLAGSVEVNCVTLDQAMEAAEPCRAPFLKLDAQGWDLRILRAGRHVLSDFVGVQTELSVQPIYEESEDFREAYAFLLDAGFLLHAITPVHDVQHLALREVNGVFVRADLI